MRLYDIILVDLNCGHRHSSTVQGEGAWVWQRKQCYHEEKDQNGAITKGIIKASPQKLEEMKQNKIKKDSFLENLGGAQVCRLVSLGPTETNLGLLVLRTVTESVPVI